MEKNKKYRLGNQDVEFELVTRYLGWLPEGVKDWGDIFSPLTPSSETNGKEVTLINPEKDEKVSIIIDHLVIKDAFPLSFYGEERARFWRYFCIVSNKDKPLEKFIIPLH